MNGGKVTIPGSGTETLERLYAIHDGNISDKWSSYLVEYERLLAEYRDGPIRLLEIGVQNGGSLEIWSRYFAQARGAGIEMGLPLRGGI